MRNVCAIRWYTMNKFTRMRAYEHSLHWLMSYDIVWLHIIWNGFKFEAYFFCFQAFCCHQMPPKVMLFPLNHIQCTIYTSVHFLFFFDVKLTRTHILFHIHLWPFLSRSMNVILTEILRFLQFCWYKINIYYIISYLVLLSIPNIQCR